MKILGKNVVIGTKKICTTYTYKFNKNISNEPTENIEYNGDIVENNVVFIIDSKGYLVETLDLGSFPTLSLICYGAATRWKTAPLRAGDMYIDKIKPFFAECYKDTLFDIKLLIDIVKNKKSYLPKEDTLTSKPKTI